MQQPQVSAAPQAGAWWVFKECLSVSFPALHLVCPLMCIGLHPGWAEQSPWFSIYLQLILNCTTFHQHHKTISFIIQRQIVMKSQVVTAWLKFSFASSNPSFCCSFAKAVSLPAALPMRPVSVCLAQPPFGPQLGSLSSLLVCHDPVLFPA